MALTPPIDEADLEAALADNLSPQAVVAIAASLQAHIGDIKHANARSQVRWFRNMLDEMVGDDYNDLLEEIGF